MPLQNMPAEYLGDGAYVTVDHGELVIYTSNGERNTNQVYIQDGSVDDLVDFITRARGAVGIALGSKGLRVQAGGENDD